jgi:transcriptional regulator with XRE-family HTH domain
LNREQLEYAVTRLKRLIDLMEVTQTQLEAWSGVNQSTISKIVSPLPDNGAEPRYTPSEDTLRKLFKALGQRLENIITESEGITSEITGYLATPLTGLPPAGDKEVRRAVRLIKAVASEKAFDSPKFDIYWPGDHTHPLQHAEISPKQVYAIDRSRAASHDFIILFCPAPSLGVGQENEIATQAGVPAIRIFPKGISRMMTGSFINAIDISLSGSLDTGVQFECDQLRNALFAIRKAYFHQQALYQKMNGDGFGPRLRKLIDDRSGDYLQFAADLGISLAYLQSLMEDPFAISNPSATLLRRMGRLLGERVGYLMGEKEESDPVWIESNNSFRSWVDKTPGIDARIALQMRDDWRAEYAASRREVQTSASFRKPTPLMREADWDKRYQRSSKAMENEGHGRQQQLLEG